MPRDKQIAAAAVQDGNGPVRGREGRHTLYVKQRLVAGKEQVEGSISRQVIHEREGREERRRETM